ncbi:DUF2523 family protein [Photobacterium profundum]|uniref:DUF2523 family protein n=1 Tax=Photobacterium profundum TaxID=74109 RepID=UPI003D130F13
MKNILVSILFIFSMPVFAADGGGMFSWITELWEQFKVFMLNIVYTIKDMLSDLIISIVAVFLSFIDSALDSVMSLLSPIDFQQYINLPSNVVGVLAMIGIPQCLGIIAVALSVRLTMQLIPFVRLGS